LVRGPAAGAHRHWLGELLRLTLGGLAERRRGDVRQHLRPAEGGRARAVRRRRGPFGGEGAAAARLIRGDGGGGPPPDLLRGGPGDRDGQRHTQASYEYAS